MSQAAKMAALALGKGRWRRWLRWLRRHPPILQAGNARAVQKEVFDRILAAPSEREVGLVLSDMAAWVLKGGAGAPIKLFRGTGLQDLVQGALGRFAKVKLVAAAVWRSRSPEMYLLAKDFRLV